MVTGSYLSIITLNVNGLNAPTKRQRLAEWIQKQDPYICYLQETDLKTRDTYRLKVMKDNNLQPRLLYPARISFKYEGEIKSFTDKQKLREFSTTKPALQQMLKDIL